MESGPTATSVVRSALPVIGEELKMIPRASSAVALGIHANGNGNGNNGNSSAARRAMVMRAASFGAIHTVDETWCGDIGALNKEDYEEEEDPSTSEGSHGYDELPATMEPAIHVRRRFYSSDVVLRSNPSGGYYSKGNESPTVALRQWIANGGGSEQSPAQFIRHRQRRRTQSSDLTTIVNRNSNGFARRDYPVRRSFERGNPASHNAIAEEIHHEYISTRGRSPDDYDSDSDHHDSESELGNLSRTTRSRRTRSEDSNCSSVSGSSFYSNPAARSYESASHDDPPSVEKLLNLQKLYQEGFITVTEYKDRRLQLVDELTVTDKTINRTTDLIQTSLPVVHRDPPDFTTLRERDAIKHIFDSEKRKWTSSRIKVKIDPQPFARGGLRQVFHLQDLSVIPRLAPEGRPVSYVAKIAIDVNEDPDTYFRDVEMQAVASKFANLYNTYNPPRRVEFLDAWILQLVPTSNGGTDDDITMRGTICGVEPYIAGEYHKHNNNFGYVSELERNTPQAFSHFTYEASGRQMLIVDIQGVSDHYTDPQIHTRSGKEFGKGNLAVRGFERFSESHRCNPICRYLKLPLINPKDADDEGEEGGHAGARNDGKGTVPAQTYMSQPRVRIKRVDSELCHYYGDSKAFKKYQAKHSSNNLDTSDDATSAFVAALKEQRNCSSFCGVGLCTIS